jgi:hypothetical protein
MNSHKLSLDTKITVYDKDIQPLYSIESPKEVEVSDDYIEFLVKEANGEVVQKQQIPMHSFTKNWMGLWDFALANITTPTYAMTRSDNSKNVNLGANDTELYRCEGPVNNSNYGIVVGTGSLPMTASDYKLAGQCIHGTDPGQLVYGAQTFTQISSTGSLRQLTLKRTFLNSDAGTTTVTECGFFRLVTNFSVYELLSRDLLQYNGISINIPVIQNQTLEVTYNFLIDVTQGFVDNFLMMLAGNFMANTSAPIVSLTGITNTFDTFNAAQSTFYCLYGEGQWPTGICVGSDSATPVSSSNYKLGSIIYHGSSSGQLWYGNSQYSQYTASLVSQSMYSVMTRKFKNYSNDSIQVKEAGLIITGSSISPFFQNILIARKIIGTVNLLPQQTMDVALIFNVSTSLS